MSEQLSFNLDLDASPMLNAASTATKELEQKFKQAGNNIRQELEKPIVIQGEFNLDGDPRKTYDEIVSSQKRILDEQSKINKKVSEQKKVQDQVSKALNGSNKEKKEALKLVERLLKETGKTKEEMKVLAQYAKDLKKSLPKDSDMPSSTDLGGLEGSLTKAGIAANLATKAIEAVGKAITDTIQTGVQMQSLNLQMEAFAGGAQEAELAMARFADIAAQTPLDVMQVAEAGKIMMAFGVDTDLAAEATERLAITAAATGGDVNLLARNLGQVQAQGRAYTRDLTQFAIQGIPIWEELSNVTGKSVAELKDLAREGEIGMQAVIQALRNMTAEGSAFAMVAERMQETYAGKLAKLQSDFQITAGAIVESINTIDNALGGVSDNVVNYISESLKGIQSVLEQTAALVEQEQLLKALEGPSFFDEMKQAVIDAERFIEQLRYGSDEVNKMFGGVEGLGNVISTQFIEAKDSADRTGMSMTQLTSKINELRGSEFGSKMVDQFADTALEAGALREELDAYIETLMDMSGVSMDVVAQRKSDLEEERTALEAAKTDIEAYYDSLKTSAQDSYAQIKQAGEESIANSQAIIDNLNEQIRATQELGPAGQKLEEIKRRELEYTAATGKELKGHITDEEMKKLRAQATLEQLDGQAKAEELRKQVIAEQKKIEDDKKRIKEEEQKLNEKLKKIDEERVSAINDQNQKIGDLNDSINSLIGVLNGDLAPNWEAIEGLIEDSATQTSNVDSETGILNNTINDTIGKYNTILGQLDDMAKKIRNMPSLPSGSAPNTFSGGPVSGGELRTVNELGKEAFLSASGKLSMINAPAWGEWRAPSSGTIIPAHLTKQLDIPTGGININRAAGAGARVGSAVKVIQAASGDTFHQNVTVQAANPVQAANNMMVEMTRLRRRRFG